MKKIFAILLCAVLLVSAFTVTAFAATDVEFSVKGAEGKPGDLVNVEVYLDKNPGTWACRFETHFDDRYFTLISVENGDVFTDGEFTKGLLTNKGFYNYYAESAKFDANNNNTGLILTLTFEVSKACPNGAHDITLSFPDDGYGYFFDGTDYPDFDTQYSVSCTKDAQIIVTGSDATEAPDTDSKGEIVEPDETKPAPGIPVTEAVKNEDGEIIKNDDGSVMTQEVKDENGNVIYYETNSNGSVVKDDDGNPVTFADTTAEVNTSGDGSDNGDDDDDKGFFEKHMFKIILAAAIVAVVAGAIIVIIVITKTSKAAKPGDDE